MIRRVLIAVKLVKFVTEFSADPQSHVTSPDNIVFEIKLTSVLWS